MIVYCFLLEYRPNVSYISEVHFTSYSIYSIMFILKVVHLFILHFIILFVLCLVPRMGLFAENASKQIGV